MKQGWEVKKLSEIGKIFNGNSINEKVKKEKYTDISVGLPYIATKDVSYESIIDYNNGIKIPFEEKGIFKKAPKNTVLICAEGGSAGRKIGYLNQEVCFGNKLFAFVGNKNIDSKYVFYYYFSSGFQKYFSLEMAGIIGGVSMNKFKDLEIPLPPLQEQKRIVAILDEAFTAIDKAKANTEQNLKNVKELFERTKSEIFNKLGDDRVLIASVCNEIFAGGDAPKDYSKERNKKHNIPIIANAVKDNGLYGYSDKERVSLPSITIAARGSGTGHTEIRYEPFFPIVRLIVLTPNTDKITLEFLKYSVQNLDILSSGSAIPQLTVPMLKEYSISLPSIKEQQTIVSKLDALREQTKKLEAVYTQKLQDLDELKKSVLQKAFSGDL